MPKCQIQNKGKIYTETFSDVLDLPRIFAYSIFDPGRDTGSSLGPLEQERVTPVEPPCATIAKEEKSCEFSRQGDGDSVLGY